MRKRKSRFKEVPDAEFMEALSESESDYRSSDSQVQRKTQQFCRQVQRTLNLALADCSALGELSGLFIEEVSPAPDCGRLLVQVVVPPDCSFADAMGALRRAVPQLRQDVAKAITRKRAPELFFSPALSGGGTDE